MLPSGQWLYKIGVTSLSIEERFKRETVGIRSLWEKSFDCSSEAYRAEESILDTYIEDLYEGPMVFNGAGDTELFVRDVLGHDPEKPTAVFDVPLTIEQLEAKREKRKRIAGKLAWMGRKKSANQEMAA